MVESWRLFLLLLMKFLIDYLKESEKSSRVVLQLGASLQQFAFNYVLCFIGRN